jgi:hypothetical protein
MVIGWVQHQPIHRRSRQRRHPLIATGKVVDTNRYEFDITIMVLWYDLVYAVIYVQYIATLHQLLHYELEELAAIWRNFAINAVSYVYIFTKCFTLAYSPPTIIQQGEPLYS